MYRTLVCRFGLVRICPDPTRQLSRGCRNHPGVRRDPPAGGGFGALALVALLLNLPSVVGAPLKYSVLEFPDAPGHGQLRASGLNNKGEVVFWGNDTATGWSKMFIYLPSPAYGLPAGMNAIELANRRVEARAINDHGLVAGWMAATDVVPNRTMGFTWQNGVFHEFNFDSTSDNTTVRSVNNAGFIAGTFEVPRPGQPLLRVTRGFVRTTNDSIILNPVEPSTNHTYAIALNNSNLVAGNYEARSTVGIATRGYLWDGTLTPLGPYAVGDELRVEAMGFNDSNEIVGMLRDLSPLRPFLWLPAPKYGLSAGLNEILPAVGTGNGDDSIRINNGGQVATPQYLWDRGTTYAMSELLPASQADPIGSVVAINDRGQVLVRLRTGNIIGGPALLTPGPNDAIVVNVTSDAPDADPNDGIIDVDLDEPESQVSLRAAIDYANSADRPGPDTIEFNIDSQGAGLAPIGSILIAVTNALPDITEPLTIDGMTQPGTGLVGIKGLFAGVANGLRLVTSNCVIRGLSIQQFQRAGILIEGGHSHSIRGNLLGTDARGTPGLGNGVGIQVANSARNILGGSAAADRNVISANLNEGVAVSNSTAIELRANLIGTTPDGAAGLLNGGAGLLARQVSGLSVGSPGVASVINSATAAVLRQVDTGQMMNCLVGLNANGDASLGGTATGIEIEQSSDFNLGGSVRNIFGGISSIAVKVLDSTNVQALGNYIGTDRGGNTSIPVGTGIVAERTRGFSLGSTTLNVICATNGAVFRQLSSIGTNLNKVVNCNFGVGANGITKLGDMINGLLVEQTEQLGVGGTARNIFGGISSIAIKVLDSTNVQMTGNYIGTDRNGNTSVPVGTGILAENSRAIVVGSSNALSVICATNGTIFRRVASLVTNVSGVLNTHFGIGAGGSARVGNMVNGLVSEQSDGLVIGGTSRNVFGGIISNAITLLETTNAQVAANYIGTDRTGNASLPVSLGIFADKVRNIAIGVSNSLSVISATNGALLRELSGLSNTLNNCFFGLAANGSNKVGNMRSGLVAERSSGLSLGGVARNVFGHLSSNAISFQAVTNVQVLANLLGTDAAGLLRAPIGGDGISAMASRDVTIGDETARGTIKRAVLQIGACARHGLEAIDSSGVRVVNSIFGTDATGTRSLSNSLSAVKVHFSADFAAIAPMEATAITGNTLAFNGGSGVEISQEPAVVAHEVVHVIQGNTVRNNARDGIQIGTNVSSVLIGGSDLSRANVITRNGASGISKKGIGQRFFVEINSILSNSVKAIERVSDPLDQVAPIISSAIKGSTRVQGTAHGQPNQTVRLHFYAHRPKAGPQGEGELWVGTVQVPIDASGAGSYAAVLPRTSPAGWLIASTAADPVRGTSEFSNSQPVQLPVDTDGDGLPDFWEAQYPSCLDPLVPDPPGEDCDGDGFTNLQEYVAHTDPTRADSALRVENLVAGLAGTSLRFTGVAGRQYGLERRDNLVSGSWIRVVTAIPESDGQVTLGDPEPPEPAAYYRVVAEFP